MAVGGFFNNVGATKAVLIKKRSLEVAETLYDFIEDKNQVGVKCIHLPVDGPAHISYWVVDLLNIAIKEVIESNWSSRMLYKKEFICRLGIHMEKILSTLEIGQSMTVEICARGARTFSYVVQTLYISL